MEKFNDALKAEPFATFARNNNINTQNFTWTPSSASLDFEIRGESGHFSKYTPGWETASAAVAAAARALEPTPEYSFIHTGEDCAPLALIGDFYGHSAYATRSERLASIQDLLTHSSFPSLRPSNSNDLQSAHIIEQQRQTAETIAKEFSRPVSDLPPSPVIKRRPRWWIKPTGNWRAKPLLPCSDSETKHALLMPRPLQGHISRTSHPFDTFPNSQSI